MRTGCPGLMPAWRCRAGRDQATRHRVFRWCMLTGAINGAPVPGCIHRIPGFDRLPLAKIFDAPLVRAASVCLRPGEYWRVICRGFPAASPAPYPPMWRHKAADSTGESAQRRAGAAADLIVTWRPAPGARQLAVTVAERLAAGGARCCQDRPDAGTTDRRRIERAGSDRRPKPRTKTEEYR